MSEFETLLKGASIRQISLLFEVHRDVVAEAIRDGNVQPTGDRAGNPVYRVVDVAPYLVRPVSSGQKVQRRSASTEKDYWDAQLKRQKFLENAGDLWRTEKVIDVLAEIFKHLRESIVVFLDTMEHESGLPPAQIDRTKAFGDALMQNMHDKLVALNVDTSDDHDFGDSEDDFLRSVGLI